MVFNIIYIDPGSIIRSFLAALLLTGLFWLLFRLIVGEWTKAGIITVWALILFFSYGHVYLQLQKSLGEAVRHRLLAGGYLVFFIAGTWWVWKKLRSIAMVQSVLLTIGGVLTGFALIQLIGYEYSINRQLWNTNPVSASGSMEPAHVVDGEHLPDIYWILLDGHARSDILMEKFGYDNSAFIQELEVMGFYVAQCSQSNYPSTRYSVTSLMNANYLDGFPV